MKCGRPTICAGSLRHAITVERRTLSAAVPGSAEPEHDYTTILTTRASIDTNRSRPWNGVNVDDASTHTITIRYTSIAFDTRDRIRDARGNLYVIQDIENVGEYDEMIRLSCSRRGPAGTEANQ